MGDGGDVELPRVAVQVGGDGDGGVIAGVNGGGVRLQAQVACGRVHKERVRVQVAAAVGHAAVLLAMPLP